MKGELPLDANAQRRSHEQRSIMAALQAVAEDVERLEAETSARETRARLHNQASLSLALCGRAAGLREVRELIASHFWRVRSHRATAR